MLSFFSLLMNVAIIWSNEVVKVPLGDNIDHYKNLPEATLYLNDEVAEDRLMYYEYEIYYTSFNVIRTNVVGTYTVWYRVHFPSIGFESEAAIQFVVYDHIKPTIHADKDYYIDVGSKPIEYKNLVVYGDNYDDTKDLNLTIHSSLVQYDQIGTYPVTYKVVDKGFNETIFIQNVHVVDRVSPTIKQKASVILKVGEKLNLDQYFTFEDNYDKVLHKTLHDHLVNYQIPGSYDITIIVKDQSGNETNLTVNIQIMDQSAPVIHLKTQALEVNYQTNLTDSDLRDLILTVSDNIDSFEISDVEIISFLNTQYLGNYEVIYRLTDSGGLVGESKLLIKVLDLEPPSVIQNAPIEVLVHDVEPYIYDYLSIYDNYDQNKDLTITKTGTISMNKVGSYRILVKVKDQAKNEIEVPVMVHVIDNIPPRVVMEKNITITNFLRPDYQLLMQISDNYDQKFEVTIFDEFIDYSKIGVHDVKIKVEDGSKNITEFMIKIDIKDMSYPEVILTTNQIYLNYGVEKIDYLTYVETIYDSYDKDLRVSDIIIESAINFSVVGLYQVVYKIKDQSGNEGQSYLYVYLSDYEAPIISANAIDIKQGSQLNYLNYVKAYDNYDGDISHLVKMNPNFIPTSNPGYYEVTFYVHDSSGNYAETKVLITVLEENDFSRYAVYGAGLVLIVGGFVIYYIYRKKHEKF